MAIFRFFKMADVRHVGFSNSGNFNGRPGSEAPFCHNQSNGSFSIFFKMAVVRHIGLVGHILGPITNTTWRSLSSDEIWLESTD